MKILLFLFAAALATGCVQLSQLSNTTEGDNQGIYGRIYAYGIGIVRDCTQVPQEERGQCETNNNPQGQQPSEGIFPITIRNLENNHTVSLNTNMDGSYNISLKSGNYEACLVLSWQSCSGILTVEYGKFIEYSFGIPRQ